MMSHEALDLLPPIQGDEFLPSISRWTTWGGVALLTVFGAGVILAAATPYSTTVKAPAVVRPTGDLRVVQVEITGTVQQILAQEGDEVQAGSVIAVLDGSRSQTQQQQLVQTIQSTEQQLTQLATQMQAIDREMRQEARVAEHAIAALQANLTRDQRDYQEHTIAAQAQVQEAQAALDLAQAELQRYQQLVHTGAVAELEVVEKEQAFKSAQARLTRAQAGLNPSNAAMQITTEQMQQQQAQKASTLALLTQQKQDLVRQQLTLEQIRDRSQRELQQLQHDIHQNRATAPIQGKLLHLTLRNPGQVVQAGETIAQIAPTATPLVIKARVPAADIAQVHLCQPHPEIDCVAGRVQMRVSAYPYPDYGTLPGIVTAISADAISADVISAEGATARPAESGTPYYEVTIKPDRTYLERQNQHYVLQPGMEVTAEIVSTKETVLMLILRKTRLLLNV